MSGVSIEKQMAISPILHGLTKRMREVNCDLETLGWVLQYITVDTHNTVEKAEKAKDDKKKCCGGGYCEAE